MDILTPRHLKIAKLVSPAVLILAGYLWLGREFALGVLVGGLVVVINFHLLHQSFARHPGAAGQSPPGGSPGQGLVRRRQLLRFFVLLAIIFLLVGQRLVISSDCWWVCPR